MQKIWSAMLLVCCLLLVSCGEYETPVNTGTQGTQTQTDMEMATSTAVTETEEGTELESESNRKLPETEGIRLPMDEF